MRARWALPRSAKHAVWICPRHANRRGEADEQPRDHRYSHGVRQNAAIQSEVESHREVTRQAHRRERTHRPCSQKDTGASAKHGEHQTLGHHLSNEAAASGAERGADRELAAPACCSCQQQVRHIHRGHDHDEDDHRDHDRSAERIGSKLIFFGTSQAFRQDPDSQVCVRVRVLSREALSEDVHHRLGLVDGDTWPQPRDGMQAASLPVVETGAAAPVQRQIQLRFRERERPGEIGRCHADDRAGAAVHHDGSADHRWIAREPALPGRVSKDYDRVDSAGRPLVGPDHPSKSRPNVEQREVVARHPRREDACRFATGRGKAEEPDTVTSDVLEHVDRGRAVILEIGERNTAEGPAGGLPARDHDETVPVPDRQGPQDDGVHHAENSGVDANAQPEGDDRREGEAGVLCSVRKAYRTSCTNASRRALRFSAVKTA